MILRGGVPFWGAGYPIRVLGTVIPQIKEPQTLNLGLGFSDSNQEAHPPFTVKIEMGVKVKITF